MCGICGYIHFDRNKRPSEAILKSMMGALIPRGPDDEGIYLKDNVALGHRRLSIIDLDTGRQPILNEDLTIAIVYNGEVYNFPELKETLSGKGHIFRTHSDTEVVLHAYEEYGEECLKIFNGMYAFAIWDSKKELLFLARDRYGKKPLYYAIFDNQFIFGSELKAILKHPSARKEIDLNAVSKYLAYEYVPSPMTIFKKIYKMRPASMIIFRNGSIREARYWDISFGAGENLDLKEAETVLVKLLKESVRKRLISDVPLGVFLSGGMDSSSVVAMMAELISPKEIKTFSIGFKEKSFDESDDARRIASHFGTDHHEEVLGPRAMLEVFPDILNILDEPFADSSIIPTYLVSRFTRRHVKVALGGDGGDEFFLGYPSFLAHKLNSYFSLVPDYFKRIPSAIMARAVPASHDSMGLNVKAKRFFKGFDYPESIRHQVWIGSFSPKEQKKLFLPGGSLSCDPMDVYDLTDGFYQSVKSSNPLDRAMYIYVKSYMTDDILTKVDRASMANSLEVRAPFLDKDFTEFAARIPHSFKLRNFKTKWILKHAFRHKLPPETLNKSKQGFAVPVAEWLKKDLKGLLVEAFDEKKIKREGIFDHAYIADMTRRFMENKSDMRKEIWALFMFEMWYDKWMK